MFKKTIKVLISQSFNNQQIIIENKFDLFDYRRCKRQLHDSNEIRIDDISLNLLMQ